MSISFDITECPLSASLSLSKFLFQAYPNDNGDIYIRSDDLFVEFGLKDECLEDVKYGDELAQGKDFKQKDSQDKIYWIVKQDCPIIKNYEELKSFMNGFLDELEDHVSNSWESFEIDAKQAGEHTLQAHFDVSINLDDIKDGKIVFSAESIYANHAFQDSSFYDDCDDIDYEDEDY